MFESLENEITEKETAPMVSYFWKGLALFLLGVIAGLVVSPVKNGVTIGCNNKISKDSCADHFDDDDDGYEDEGVKF